MSVLTITQRDDGSGCTMDLAAMIFLEEFDNDNDYLPASVFYLR